MLRLRKDSCASETKPIKRHRLTADEKATVVKLYEELGEGCWEKVQQVLRLKSKRTAREHFYKFLITDSKKPFTPEEDQMILEKVSEFGTKWSFIAKFFNNRSDINIRNRHRIISKQNYQNRACKRRTKKAPEPEQKGISSIVLEFTHADILHFEDMSCDSNGDYFSPLCFKMAK